MGSLIRYRKKQEQETPRFLSLNEAARYVRTSYRTLKRLVDEGRLPCAELGVQTYRISRETLDRFINGGGEIENDYGKDGQK